MLVAVHQRFLCLRFSNKLNEKGKLRAILLHLSIYDGRTHEEETNFNLPVRSEEYLLGKDIAENLDMGLCGEKRIMAMVVAQVDNVNLQSRRRRTAYWYKSISSGQTDK